MPVGGVQAPAPRRPKHQGVCLAGEPVTPEVGVENLGDQARDRYGAAPGGARVRFLRITGEAGADFRGRRPPRL